MQSTFLTRRLSLSLITDDDCDFILKLVNTKGWLEFIGDRNIYSKKEALNYIRKIKNKTDFYYWVVKTEEQNIPTGIISFLKRDYLDYFDIGFAFLPEFFNKGYAFEAAKIVLDYLTNNKAHQNILAITIPENFTSIKLLHKLGFYFEKEMYMQNTTIHVYINSLKQK